MNDSDSPNIAFHDLPADHFPLLIRYIKEDGSGLGRGETVGWSVITGPGVLKIPGFGGSGFKISTSIQAANGQATIVTSDGIEYFAEMTPDMIDALHRIAEAVESGRVQNGHMPPTEEAS